MNRHHKSLSFLMELLIVIFFFTIASGICVLVMSNAKEKQLYAQYVDASLRYGQNLIDENSSYLKKEVFYLDQDGNPKDTQDIYKVEIHITQQGTSGNLCEMKIFREHKECAVLSFYQQEVS